MKVIESDMYIVTPEAHWIWLGSVSDKGYPVIWYSGKKHRVHRVMFEQETGIKLSKGRDLHHKCAIKLCINPACQQELTKSRHAELSTLAIKNRNKTSCPRGHEYTLENTRMWQGNRLCKECNKRVARNSYRTRSLSC